MPGVRLRTDKYMALWGTSAPDCMLFFGIIFLTPLAYSLTDDTIKLVQNRNKEHPEKLIFCHYQCRRINDRIYRGYVIVLFTALSFEF